MPNHPELVICLTGPRGAGKSLLSRLLRKKYDAADIHIGYIMRFLASKEGITPIELMNRLIQEKGKESVAEAIAPFVQSASKKAKVVVVQGVYRPEDINGLKRIFPTAVFHSVFLDAPSATRVRRVAERDRLDTKSAEQSVRERDAQRKSYGIAPLKRLVDQRIRNNGDIPSLFRRVNARIQMRLGARRLR